jgi:hypothetical protein
MGLRLDWRRAIPTELQVKNRSAVITSCGNVYAADTTAHGRWSKVMGPPELLARKMAEAPALVAEAPDLGS